MRYDARMIDKSETKTKRRAAQAADAGIAVSMEHMPKAGATSHSSTFKLLHRAILDRKQVAFTYKGHHREACPYILGHKDGREALLVFQFGGYGSDGLPVRGKWRCFKLSGIGDVTLRDGPWRGDAEHRATQSCVDEVFIDVNTAVPNQPGRR